MSECATLTVRGQSFSYPLCEGIDGPPGIDISKLRADTGMTTLDTGLLSTATCQSAVTYLDGELGILRYRGYPVEELAARSSFVETAYLLMYGELPNQAQLTNFSSLLNQSSMIYEDMRHFFLAFPNHAHPMGILATMVASLSTFYPIPEELADETEKKIIANLVSQVRTIAAFSYKKSI